MTNCKEDNTIYQPSFCADINNKNYHFETQKVIFNNEGIRITAENQTIKTKIQIIIFGNKIGNYKQEFDPITGVSTTKCRLLITYPPALQEQSNYMVSFEGIVKLNNINKKTKKISGTFNFDTKGTGNTELKIKNGSFINLPY